MGEILDTKEIHSNSNGSYTDVRTLLHDEIISTFLIGTSQANPTGAHLLGGGSGAGKSESAEVIRKLFEKSGNGEITLVEPDKIKPELPEYIEQVKLGDKNAASIVHNESSDIATRMIEACIAEKRNFIYDGTMKNYEKYKNLITSLRENGYKVNAWIVDCPIEVAINRANARAEETGREVPPGPFIESHKSVAKVFLALMDQFDQWTILDNSVDGREPVEIASKTSRGLIEIYNEELYSAFLAKGNE